MLVPSKKVLQSAQKDGYAVGAFNADTLEMVQAIVQAAKARTSPAIIATSESAIAYVGAETLKEIVRTLTKGNIPFVLHLDHGKNIRLIKHCIDLGWTSVMYDGSLLPFRTNIKNTQTVARYAHERGVSVEAELGALTVQEEGDEKTQSSFTDPQQAAEFVNATRIDSLAVAIGTTHGAFKAKNSVKLDYRRLKEIRNAVAIPLVLHGASSLPRSLQAAMHFMCENVHDCMRLEGAQGVSSAAIKKCVSLGIAKVNVGTDLRAAFVAGLRNSLLQHTASYDERELLRDARSAVQKIIEQRMELFGSVGKVK